MLGDLLGVNQSYRLTDVDLKVDWLSFPWLNFENWHKRVYTENTVYKHRRDKQPKVKIDILLVLLDMF